MLKNKKRKGFTLIELIIVMAIMAILVALATPMFVGYTKDAKVSAMKADVKVLSNAALIYNLENEAYPRAFTDAGVIGTYEGSAIDVDAAAATLPTALKNGPDKDAGTTADNVTGTAVELSDIRIAEHVKNLSGDLSDYVLIVDGPFEGEVFHKTGVEAKDGSTVYGIDFEVAK